MKRQLLSLALIATSLCAMAQQVINVWPDGPADDNGADNLATLTVYTPGADVENTGIAMVICPGGGYAMLALDHEGHQMAKILADNGITATVLKYRLPNGHHNIPADDAREAIRIVRRNADKWGVNPDKVGISGFSAGGHLASTVLTHHADSLSVPSYGLLFYPVVSARPGITHDGSANNLLGDKVGQSKWVAEYSNAEHVDKTTPPTMLLLSSNDDTVWVDNSLQFYKALVDNGIETEMHIYPIGGHGWGMHPHFKYHDVMTRAMIDWIKGR
ncbi:MAG: alpha/beta hydrolase [Muribaculaceae bacterium]|nr:alpha/beta hydrolase [Muribaculaceae bacterium]